jgi:Rrf2 family protein
MMISKKSIYGIKAIMNLARNPDRGQALIANLAEEERIPKKFLETILLSLKNAGVLSSRIGKGGGYTLLASPRTLTIGRIVRILEGGMSPIACLTETDHSMCAECGDHTSCGIRLVMTDVQKAISSIMDTVTVADMINRSDEAALARNDVLDYSI